MKLTDTVHCIASGGLGFDLTDPLDCNVFVLTDGRRHVCFDAGAGRSVDAMLAEMSAAGLDPAGVEAIVLTHAHADHSGGAAELAERLDAELVAGPATADILASGDERRISLDRARGTIYPLDYAWRARPVDRVLTPGEVAEIGPFAVAAVATPGHSDDHTSYLVDGAGVSAFVSGDALFADGAVFLQDIPDASVPKTIATIRALAGIEFQTFLPGHGRVSLRNGRRHVDAAMRYAAVGVPPPQLFVP